MSIRAQFEQLDDRAAARRTLRLEVHASSSSPDAPIALIRNLSERGLLLETAAGLVIGETIQVDLPEAGASPARVVWTDGSFFGCEFIRPVSRAAVSAALLLAPVEQLQSVSALPDVPAYANFGDEQARSELTHETRTPGLDLIVMASLVVSLLIAAIFVYALLTFEFST